MIGLALSALFIVSGLFACLALVLAWRAYGAEMLEIRSQLRDMTDRAEVIVRSGAALPAQRTGIRPRVVVRPAAPRPALRAAA